MSRDKWLPGLAAPDDIQGVSLKQELQDVDSPGKSAALTTFITTDREHVGNIHHHPTEKSYSIRTKRWRYTEWSDGERETRFDDDPAVLARTATIVVDRGPGEVERAQVATTRGDEVDGIPAVDALTDVLGDGLSMVYSFFDPDYDDRSLGTFMILDHINRARKLGLPYVYLGYWVAGSPKMDYKRRFRPQEHLMVNGWVRVD